MLNHRTRIAITQWHPEPLWLRLWHQPWIRDGVGAAVVVLVVLFLVFFLEPTIRAAMEK
jgi:hypothetical protein